MKTGNLTVTVKLEMASADSFADMLRDNADDIAALVAEKLEASRNIRPEAGRDNGNSICNTIVVDVVDIINDMINNNHPIRRKT